MSEIRPKGQVVVSQEYQWKGFIHVEVTIRAKFQSLERAERVLERKTSSSS